MIGKSERLVYRVAVVSLPVIFASFVNEQLTLSNPVVPQSDLPTSLSTPPPPASTSPRYNFVEGFRMDLPKTWFTNSHSREHEFVQNMFSLTLLSLLAFPRLLTQSLGISTVSSEQDVRLGKYTVTTTKDTSDVTFSFLSTTSLWGWPLKGGEYTVSVQDVDRQTVRVWVVQRLSLNSSSNHIAVKSTQHHNYLGEIPNELVDVDSKQVVSNMALTGVIMLQRFWIRFLMDHASTKMMRKKPLISFFNRDI